MVWTNVVSFDASTGVVVVVVVAMAWFVSMAVWMRTGGPIVADDAVG